MQNLDHKSLQGCRVLVTRASHQSGGLSGPLRNLGATVIEIPTIEIKAPGSYGPLDAALGKIDHYNTLILTSVNGVEVLFERCKHLGVAIGDLKHLRVVAIGPATAAEIQAEGITVSVVPEKYIAESVIEALQGTISAASRVLIVRAKVARDILPRELEKMGATVEVLEAYETVVPEGAREKLAAVLSDPAARPQVITFTSSSTASNFLALLGENSGAFLRDVHLASIGPVTSGTLRRAGFPPAIEATEYTMNGLVAAIRDYVAK